MNHDEALDRVLRLPLEVLELPEPVEKFLANAGVQTLGDAVRIDRETLARLPTWSRKQLEHGLADWGLELKPRSWYETDPILAALVNEAILAALPGMDVDGLIKTLREIFPREEKGEITATGSLCETQSGTPETDGRGELS